MVTIYKNFLTDPQEGRSTLRPADVLVYGWIGGKHACEVLLILKKIKNLQTQL
jgi:hypothetical protein